MRADLWRILEPVVVDPARKSWKDVLRNLVFHANENGEAWPNIDTIRREVGYKSRKAIADAIDGLVGCGLMRRVRRGIGCGTKYTYLLKVNDESVRNLLPVDNFDKGEVSSPLNVDNFDKGEVSSPLNDDKGEVSSPLTENKGEVTSRKGEVTSRKGEVTSHRSNKEDSMNSSSPSIGRKGEVTSTFVDNSAEDTADQNKTVRAEGPLRGGYDAAGRMPKRVGIMKLIESRPGVDYLSLCKKAGWKPNDPAQTPTQDFSAAKKAVIECAYRQRLSLAKSNEFWHYNAIRRWTAIDCGNTIAELAHAFADRWVKEDPEGFWAEQRRRRDKASGKVLT